MKITDLEVDGYGVWSGLRIEKLGESLNVLYGPNEAGKTTLLQFIRSMFYGFSPTRRQYLPPVHGGRPGGMLNIAGPQGRFEIGRYDNSMPDGTPSEQITLTAPDGTRQGEHFIKVLLSNVDEPVFNNVFAVGLREIQELATLGDTEAAASLYSLSAGLDRVSLVEVLRELENSRNRILDASGKPCHVVQLLADREKICADIEELGAINRRYGHLVSERDQLQQEITRLEEETTRTEQLSRILDLAIATRERWQRRASLDDQILALGPQKSMPDDAVARLDAINARLRQHQERLDHFAKLREGAKREFASLKINEALWRQAARIAAMKEQEPWIVQLQGQIAELQGEIGQIEAELASQRQRLGLKPGPGPMPAFSAKTLSPLRAPAKALRQCRQRFDETQQAATAATETAESLSREIESAITARGEPDLTTALDHAGAVVSQFRRRVQLDERLEQLSRYQIELEERSRHLVDRQVPSVGMLAGPGAVFVAGVVLLLVGLLMPTAITGSTGWALVLIFIGLAGIGSVVGGKVLLARSNAQQLDGCQKQLGVLQLQIQQGKEDRDSLDAQLPRGNGSLAGRLQAAEHDLAALEELTPLDTRRSAARQEAEAATRREATAKNEFITAKRRWRDALRMAGLPDELGPKQVRRIMQHGDRLGEMQHRLAQRREDIVRRQRELDSLCARIAQLASDAGVSLTSAGPIEQLRQLAEAGAKQDASAARREAIRAHVRRVRSATAKREEAVSSLKHRRRALLLEAGVKDEQEFRQRALECARADVLRRERDTVAREIDAALSSQCSEDVIRQHLEGPQAGQLENRRDDFRQRLTAIGQQLRDLLERRGRLTEQIASIAADRRLAGKYLDLAILDKRLDEAVHRWQVLAVTCCILDQIRTTYERDRQPETLQEASGYLDRLTQGRYHRVWTPLGQQVLRVDDSDGNSLPVEVLSRGTREQLFLSLRLALTSSYARRGASLPLVLDDVLVNFDSDRAKAAAEVLRDFAATGHQLIVFTCHEHMLKLFKSLHVPVSRLPGNASGEAVIVMEHQSEEKPPEKEPAPSRRKASPKKKPPVVEPEPENEEEELVDIRPTKRKQKQPRAKKHRDTGAFDADFFDSEEEVEEEDSDNEEPDETEEEQSFDEEESEDESEDDESLWDEEDGNGDGFDDFDDDETAAA